MLHSFVLDPLLFAVYLSPISNVIIARSLHYHQWADNTLLCIALRSRADAIVQPVLQCVEDVSHWFLETGCFVTQLRQRQSCLA